MEEYEDVEIKKVLAINYWKFLASGLSFDLSVGGLIPFVA